MSSVSLLVYATPSGYNVCLLGVCSLAHLSLAVIEAFKDTLAPASLVGVAFTSCGIFFSGWVGGLVDRIPRLRFVRTTTTVQKVGFLSTVLHEQC